MHWASAALLDLLEHLADALAETRVLVVCTARPEFLDLRPAWGAGRLNATTLTLAPLSKDESAQLVSSLLGEGHVPENLRTPILASAEGNPFFVEEMLQMLIEEGAFERQNGGWVATGKLAEVRIPDSVHGVIAARIDLLDASARDALRRCSVVGRVFWPSALGIDAADVEPLTRRGLVTLSSRSAMAGLDEFVFKHALTRDVAYASLPRTERRDLHCRVAEWIQRVAPDREGETTELAAYHYRQAIGYGETAADVVRRAHTALLAAGESALRRGAFIAARAQLDYAEPLAADDSQRAATLLARGELNATEARWDDAIRDLRGAERFAATGDARTRSAILAWRSRVSWMVGNWQESLEAANGAVDSLAGLPESEQLARALARRSQIAMLRGLPQAAEHARETIEVADRVGEVAASVNGRINLFTSLAQVGVGPDVEDVLEIVERAAAVGAHEDAYRAIVNFVWSANGYLPVADIEAVAAAGREGKLPPPPIIAAYLELSIVALLLVPAGRWAEADAILARIDGLTLSATSSLLWRPTVGVLAFRRDDMAVAEEMLSGLAAVAIESGETQRIIPMACAVLPWLHLAGRPDELRVLADEILATLGDDWPTVFSVDAVARTFVVAGELELLAALTASLERAAGGSHAGRRGISLLAAQGLCALAEGDGGEAAGLLTSAVAREDELGFAYDSACLRLDLARAHALSGDAQRAAAASREAHVVLEAVGCRKPF